jgi:SP family xylose:H+ symportor-like MFS transporter
MKSTILFRSAIVAALGGLLFGFDTAVISGTEEALRALYELSDFWYGFTVASALIGTIIGAITMSKPSDKYGRKKTLRIRKEITSAKLNVCRYMGYGR